MFKFKHSWGDHSTFNYDFNKYKFKQYFKNLFNYTNLEDLYKISEDYQKYKDIAKHGFLNDRDTDLHKKFYNDIKTNDIFKIKYCNLIKDIHNHFYNDEKYIIYQSFPSVRFQFLESISVPPHKDNNHLSNHPLGEENFIIPITKMINTASIFVESECDKKDFKSITLDYGEIFKFNGNRCTHYNECNQENFLRISIDFRIIPYSKYLEYLQRSNLKKTNPRDLERNREPTKMLVGGYYQMSHKSQPLEEMMNWYKIEDYIMQHRPTFQKEEAEACYNYMLDDTFVTEFKKTSELESLICKTINSKYCFMTTSGTCAIMLSLMALDLNTGDEVIVPNYTMIATINAVKMLNLKPVIIDVDENTYTLNVDELQKYVTDKTKCVIHVSLNNRSVNLKELVTYCKNNNLKLIEDSAQSLGCKKDGKNLGTYGDIGCFSLSSPKIISTGQGGFCVTDNDELADKIRMIKNFGRKTSGIDDFRVFGINLKFTDIQAVIGIEQMKKLPYRVKRIREIYELYYKNLKGICEIKEPLDDEWIPWFVDIYCENREELVKFLKIHSIGSRPTYKQINKTNVYLDDRELPNSNYVSTKGLFLPSFITIANEQIIYICNIIKLFYQKLQ